ncbi:MAG: LEA type 2 family protein [Acidobacteriota bacterium]
MKQGIFRAYAGGAALVLVLVLVSGCVSIPPDERPEVTLSNLELTEATLFETTMVAAVRISNPALDPIVVDGASFKLVLDGKKVGRGMMKDAVTVDGLDSRIGSVTFHVNNASALLRLRDLMEQRAVGYGIVGHLYLQRGTGTTKVKVEQNGRLDLDEPEQSVRPEAER